MEKLFSEEAFKNLTRKNLENVLSNVLNSGYNFSIIADLEVITFSPELPSDITKKFSNPIRFDLANYTLSTAYLEDFTLNFEAGFGINAIGADVKIPIVGIYEILIDEIGILANFANFKEEFANIKREKLFKRSWFLKIYQALEHFLLRLLHKVAF